MKVILTVLNLAFIAVLVMGLSVVGPAIETRFFPVYSKFKVTNVVPSGEGSYVTVELTKLRDCYPQGYAWYISDLGNFTQQLNVVSNKRNPAPSYPIGQLEVTFFVENLKPEDMNRVYAETFSRCHPFWTTRSIVYP